MNKLLEMKNISKAFPGVKALDNVQFDLQKGEVHVLLGENGAGKSTLIKILSGAHTKDNGEIFIEGKEATIEKPADAFAYGVSIIYQEFNLNPYMSIYENLFLGREYTSKYRFINKQKAIKKTKEISKVVGLNAKPTTLVEELTVAEKQLVEIAKALIFEAKMIVFDEPTATLTETEIELLFKIIRDLKANGMGIVYISHRMNELKEIGDRCTILRDGQYVDTVELDQVSKNELVSKMVGRKIDDNNKKKDSHSCDEVVLRVVNLCYKDKVNNASFELRKGEILGIAGLVGAGRTELAKTIIGEFAKEKGETIVKDRVVELSSPSVAIKNDIVYLSEDRKDEGLFLEHSVKRNITISSLDKIRAKFCLHNSKEKNICQSLIEKMNIKTPSQETKVVTLSGGNQQKIVIAKGLCQQSSIYIFDEPTRGIDVGAKEEIYNIMTKLVKDGASIIMISSDMPEIMKMSDRIMVMYHGQIANIFDNTSDLSQEQILSSAIGG